MEDKFVIGLDYGSDSARALIVNTKNGNVIASAVKFYPRWKDGKYCNSTENKYRQHPLDYIEVLEDSVKEALAKSPKNTAQNVVGIAFDTTGSTPCFLDENAQPLALLPEFAENPNAMFILWKDHTAVKEAAEINRLCKQYETDYSAYEGGVYSSEWYWAKALHVIRQDSKVADKAFSIAECCEWLPALITGVKKSKDIVRSRCACGHKAMWHSKWGGLPAEDFFNRLDSRLGALRNRLYSQTETADKCVGNLSAQWAKRLGLSEKVKVAGGAFDCHMGAVGAGITPHSFVRVIGTSTCDIMIADYQEINNKLIKGICGQVDGSVIPGMIGLEAGQSAFGDIFAWFKRTIEAPIFEILSKMQMSNEDFKKIQEEIDNRLIPEIESQAAKLPIDENAPIATDWLNGRRTPDANQMLKATIAGLTLGTSTARIYKSLVEAAAFGSRAIVERFRQQGVKIDNVIGIGGISLKSELVMQTLSDVLDMPIKVCRTDQACALGAAMFAAVAAGVYDNVQEASNMMNSGFAFEYIPNRENVEIYERMYKKYCLLGEFTQQEFFNN